MPRIIGPTDGPTDVVMLSERINAADLESDHFRAHLVQRLAWAVGDAHAAERDHRDTAQYSSAQDDGPLLVHARRSVTADALHEGADAMS